MALRDRLAPKNVLRKCGVDVLCNHIFFIILNKFFFFHILLFLYLFTNFFRLNVYFFFVDGLWHLCVRTSYLYVESSYHVSFIMRWYGEFLKLFLQNVAMRFIQEWKIFLMIGVEWCGVMSASLDRQEGYFSRNITCGIFMLRRRCSLQYVSLYEIFVW